MATMMLQSDIVEIVSRLGDEVSELSGKTVILTGSRGFLGRYFMELFGHLNEHTLRAPCRLIALDNLIVSGREGVNVPSLAGVSFIRHDVIQPFSWDDPVEYIMHAAGIASPFYYRAYPLETLDVAVRGTRNMLDLAHKNRARFVFFSSSEIYGDPDAKHIPTPESYRGNVSCQGPRACYDESKRVGETLCHIFHEKNGTHTNAIRPFNVYGPGMQETDYRVLPNFASRIKSGKPLNLYGSGHQTRTFCYITDAIVGFMRVLLKGVPGEPYNIGNPRPELSMLELVQSIERVLGRHVEHNLIEYPDSYPTDEPGRRCPDIRKAKLQIGFEPTVGIDEGLSRFLGWAHEAYTGEGP